MSDQIDHKALAISRLATEFRESNLTNYVEALMSESNPLEQVFQDLLTKRFIEDGEGTQLDILGLIVGQPREFIDSDAFSYFGFAVNAISESFGTVTDVGIGGRFKAVSEPTSGIRVLNDEEYRLFIKARIQTNKTTSTPEEIIAKFKFLFNAEQVLFIDGDTQYQVSIGKILTSTEKDLLSSNIIPKTAGVNASYVTEYDFDSFFGFQGVPNSAGLGSINDPLLGGSFGNLI